MVALVLLGVHTLILAVAVAAVLEVLVETVLLTFQVVLAVPE